MSDSLKTEWGDEYPAAVFVNGKRLPLWKETRFNRHYFDKKRKSSASVPRFLDGSASISSRELQNEWPAWTEGERADFCSACGHIQNNHDVPDILRFVMQSNDPSHWIAIALSVSFRLPKEEAFTILVDRLARTTSFTANLTQALAATKHPKAPGVLRKHLDHLWAMPDLWNDDRLTNWTAFDAISCIEHLIEAGVNPSEFEGRVQRLSKHGCKDIRSTCCNYLGKHYDWLSSHGLEDTGA